jgi:hypothetical protein
MKCTVQIAGTIDQQQGFPISHQGILPVRATGAWFYNATMRQPTPAPLILRPGLVLGQLMLAAVALYSSSAALAQTQAATPASVSAIEQRTERLVVEDTDSRIEELRVGGESRKISVTPKGGMPSYEVQPSSPASGQSGASRVWKLFGF